MRDSEDRNVSLNPITASTRDAAAEERDRAAEERDFAAQVRDGVAAVGRANPYSHQRELAAQDREEAAKDRRLAAKDREAASNELAGEGIDSLTGVMRRNVGLAAVQREMDRSERDGGLLPDAGARPSPRRLVQAIASVPRASTEMAITARATPVAIRPPRPRAWAPISSWSRPSERMKGSSTRSRTAFRAWVRKTIRNSGAPGMRTITAATATTAAKLR